MFSSLQDRFAQVIEHSNSARTIPSEEIVFDEVLLARLRRLTMVSNRAISQGLSGEHRSHRRGASPEFADFKSYTQGDDFRRIDWNIYSRLGELFVRLSEVTTELTVHVLLDASNSMAWSGNPERTSKFTYARRIAGALGYIGLWHFDRLTITPFSDRLGHAFGPSHGRSNITPMLRFLTDLHTSGATSIAESIERYVRARKRSGLLIVISDLLSGEPEELQSVFQLLRSRGWQTTIVQIVDPAERDPTDGMIVETGGQLTTLELIDLETNDRLRITPDHTTLAEYDRAYRDWQQRIEQVCDIEHIPLLTLQSDWPFETVVLELLAQRGVVG